MWLRRYCLGVVEVALDPEDEGSPLFLSQDFPYTEVRIWRDPSGRFHIEPLFRKP